MIQREPLALLHKIRLQLLQMLQLLLELVLYGIFLTLWRRLLRICLRLLWHRGQWFLLELLVSTGAG